MTHAMPEFHEIGPSDFCPYCHGRGYIKPLGHTCMDCNGKGHLIRSIARGFYESGPNAICFHKGEQIGHRIRVSSSEECRYPEEDWIMGAMEYSIHLDADGKGSILMHNGAWEAQIPAPHPVTFDQLRMTMFNHFTGLPKE